AVFHPANDDRVAPARGRAQPGDRANLTIDIVVPERFAGAAGGRPRHQVDVPELIKRLCRGLAIRVRKTEQLSRSGIGIIPAGKVDKGKLIALAVGKNEPAGGANQGLTEVVAWDKLTAADAVKEMNVGRAGHHRDLPLAA